LNCCSGSSASNAPMQRVQSNASTARCLRDFFCEQRGKGCEVYTDRAVR
jgi:hypothetical protein